MKIEQGIKKLIEVFRVANDTVIGSVARQRYHLNWSEGLSERNQAHKILNTLALTKQIQKGKGFYAVNQYSGQYGEHDRKVTECIAQLILTGYPLTIHREVNFPIGLRSDLVVILGKNGKATVAIIEICNKESDEYFSSKIAAWKHFKDANKALEDILNIPVPHFALAVHGKQHPEVMNFEQFIEEVKK